MKLHVNPLSNTNNSNNNNNNNKNDDDDNRSYASSFDNCGTSISNSDQTSIMDAQYKPHIQLKFSCFCLLMFIIVWLLAACVACGLHFPFLSHLVPQHEYMLTKAFSYLFSIFLFVYSMLQLAFYVLSRDEFSCADLSFNYYPKWLHACLNSSMLKSGRKSKQAPALPLHLHPQASLHDENHWYFEPPNDTVDYEEKRPLNQQLQQQHEPNPRFKVYEAVPPGLCTLNAINDQYVTMRSHRKESPPKIETESRHLIQNDVSSSADELNQAEDDHKESICDVIFSAKKSPSLKHSIKSSDCARNRVESNSDECSTSSSGSNSNQSNTEQLNIQMGKNEFQI